MAADSPAPFSAGVRTVGSGLRFCEGPVWRGDDRVLVTEIASGTLASVSLGDGTIERVVTGLAGPNGAAAVAGDSDRLWVADNGGFFSWVEAGSRIYPSQGNPDHRGGALVVADPGSGTHEVVCTRAADASHPTGAAPLVAPNDLVVDGSGGVWCTDFGVQDDASSAGRPGVVYLPPTAVVPAVTGPGPGAGGPDDGGGAVARPVVWGTHQANGIGLSNDGAVLFVAETHSASLWAFPVEGAGRVAGGGGPTERHSGRLLHRGSGVLFDSLAVDPDGWVCVATIGTGGGITCIDPTSGETVRVGAPDDLTTNVAFRTVADGTVRAVVTLSSTGMLGVIDDWVAVREAARAAAPAP